MDGVAYSLARAAIVGSPRWGGVERGVWELRLSEGRVLSIGLEEAVVLRQVDRLLQRVVDENRETCEAVACCAEPARLLAVAFGAVAVARTVGYRDGGYTVRLRGGRTVAFYVTEWDGTLLRRHDAILELVAGAIVGDDCEVA